MSTVNESKYTLRNRYAGFCTEDSLDNLNDVINVVNFLSTMAGAAKCNKEGAILDNGIANGIFNILGREIESIKESLFLCGGTFSEDDVMPFLRRHEKTPSDSQA